MCATKVVIIKSFRIEIFFPPFTQQRLLYILLDYIIFFQRCGFHVNGSEDCRLIASAPKKKATNHFTLFTCILSHRFGIANLTNLKRMIDSLEGYPLTNLCEEKEERNSKQQQQIEYRNDSAIDS